MNKHIIIKTKTKCDMVAERIMNMIARGEYKVGDKLPSEYEFCDMFGVSRVTVREAIKRLNTHGVLSIQQGDGTYVRNVGVDSVVKTMYSNMVIQNLSVGEIYDARLFVEIGTVRLAARNRTEEELRKLSEIVESMKSLINNYDVASFSELDNTFHETIAHMSKNSVLRSTYDGLKELLLYYIEKTNFSYETAKISAEHHIQLLNHINERNEYMAGLVMEQHLIHAKESLIRSLGTEAER